MELYCIETAQVMYVGLTLKEVVTVTYHAKTSVEHYESYELQITMQSSWALKYFCC